MIYCFISELLHNMHLSILKKGLVILMERKRVSIREIGEILGNNEPEKTHQLRLRKKHGEYKVKRLHSDLIVPSYVHGYSLGIEIMQKWFLGKFEKGYFDRQNVYINGKHVLDDYKQFNKNTIKRNRPMVAIVPSVDYDFDREFLDTYLGDPALFLRRSSYQQSFFRDDERDQYLGISFQGIRMNFGFKIRVNTRAQQLDLLEKMKLRFRIGATQSFYVSVDFHIPKDIMISIAKAAGFEVNEETKTIKDVMEFVSYMNRHSDLPILFKMRAINQKPEFFLRMRDQYIHIACKDKLSPDDGERDGQLDHNFHIEMAAVLTMPVPHFYVHYSNEYLTGSTTIHEGSDDSRVGLYSFNAFQIPDYNERGWGQYALTSYLCDKGEKYIDMSEVFSGNTNLDKIMKFNQERFISPKSFIEIKVYRHEDSACLVKTDMDFDNKRLNFLEEMDEEAVSIVMYADREYVNDTITTVEKYNESRFSMEKK